MSDEAAMIDADLVRIDGDGARDELARRVDHRRRFGLPLGGLIPAHAMAFAPEATVEMLADLDLEMAQDERQRRGRGGR